MADRLRRARSPFLMAVVAAGSSCVLLRLFGDSWSRSAEAAVPLAGGLFAMFAVMHQSTHPGDGSNERKRPIGKGFGAWAIGWGSTWILWHPGRVARRRRSPVRRAGDVACGGGPDRWSSRSCRYSWLSRSRLGYSWPCFYVSAPWW